MKTYRIDFFDENDMYHVALLKRIYKKFTDETEARMWAISENISKVIEINVCE